MAKTENPSPYFWEHNSSTYFLNLELGIKISFEVEKTRHAK
jgi:hypothetical protein